MADQQQTQKWLDTAVALTPELTRKVFLPTTLVDLVPNPSAFQRWEARPAGDVAPIYEKALGKGDSFVLDFGEHIVGYCRFEIASTRSFIDAPVRLKLIFGETPAEVAEPLDPYDGQLSRAWFQDEVVNIDLLPAVVSLPRRYAFRYLRVTVVDTSPSFKITLSDIACEAVTSATFDDLALSDPALPADLKAIDEVSLRTLRNCMQLVFEDGPKRDRRLWLGDLRLEALTNYVSFKNYDLVKRCLLLFAGLARPDGTIPADAHYAPSPHPGHCFIVDYAALFVPTLLDYAEASGDWDTARELWPVAKRQIEYVLEFVDKDGVFILPDLWNFVDWSATLHKQAAMHGLVIYCARQLVALAERLGLASEVASYAERIDQTTHAAKTALWDDVLGVFVSGDERQVSWASQTWMILAGVVDAEEGAKILRRLESLPDAVKPAGAYLYHHVVEAMLQCDMMGEALALLRSYWGGMIERGATTFWEVYDGDDPMLSPYNSHLINSYCHAWSCTPAYFIRKYGIGIIAS